MSEDQTSYTVNGNGNGTPHDTVSVLAQWKAQVNRTIAAMQGIRSTLSRFEPEDSDAPDDSASDEELSDTQMIVSALDELSTAAMELGYNAAYLSGLVLGTSAFSVSDIYPEMDGS